MPLLILLSLFGVLYAEFLVFFAVGDQIGGLNAFLLTVLTAVFGLYLIRSQGLMVIQRLHQNMQDGQSPVREITHGFFLLVAGLFFLLPGFLTDSVALLLSLSPVRDVLGRAILKNVSNHFYHNSPKTSAGEGVIIDGDFTSMDSESEDSKKNHPDDNKRLDN